MGVDPLSDKERGIFKQLEEQKENDDKIISKALGVPKELLTGFKINIRQSELLEQGIGILMLHPADLYELREKQFKNKD